MNHFIKLIYFSFSIKKQFCVGKNMIILVALKSSLFFLSIDVHIVISPALEYPKSIILEKSTFFDFGRIYLNFPMFLLSPIFRVNFLSFGTIFILISQTFRQFLCRQVLKNFKIKIEITT